MNLLDVVETWAETKGWWCWKSTEVDKSYNKFYINISATSVPPFKGNDYATLYEDGKFSCWPPHTDVHLVPAHPDFFVELESLLSKL